MLFMVGIELKIGEKFEVDQRKDGAMMVFSDLYLKSARPGRTSSKSDHLK